MVNKNMGCKVLVLFVVVGMLSAVFAVMPVNVTGGGVKATYKTMEGYSDLDGTAIVVPAGDGMDPSGGYVRTYIWNRSNEIATEAQINPWGGGISETTDRVDDGTGSIGSSWIDNAFQTDIVGFPTEWDVAGGTDVVIAIVDIRNATSGEAYTCSADVTTGTGAGGVRSFYDSGTPGGTTQLQKIPSPTFTGSSVDWTAVDDGWGNVYGYRVYGSATETGTYSVIGNSTTTSLSYTPTVGYWYNISVLYRGKQSGVQDFSTAVESLRAGLPAKYTLPISITVNKPNGGEVLRGGSAYNINYTISGGAPNYNIWLNYSTNGLAGPWTPCSGAAQPVTQTVAGTFTYAWTLPSADSTNCYVRVKVVDSSSQTASDDSNSAFTIDSTAPTIISTTPANGATGVSLTQNVIVQFSEKMNTSSVEYTCFPNPGGWVSSWNAANDTLTLTHNDFNPGTTYTFNVTAGKDVAGNNLAGTTITYTPVSEYLITTGTMADFANMATDDGLYANLSEENTGGGGGTGNAIANAIGAGDTTADSLADLQVDDVSGASPSAVVAGDGWYTVDKGIVMFIGGFDTSGMSGTVSAVTLWVQFSVEAGYSGTNPIRWALNAQPLATTGITPVDGNVDRTASYNLYAQGVDTIAKISTLDVEFTSDDGAGPSAVSFDYVWVTVTYSGSGNNYQMEIQANVTSIPAGEDTYELEIYAKTSGEQFNISVWDGSQWNVRGSISSTTFSLFSYTLLPGEIISNTVRVKYTGTAETGDTTQDWLHVDYQRVKSSSGAGVPNPWSFTTIADNPPTSSASVAAPYWKTSAPFNVGWSASDDNGLTAVALYYRYSTDNSTWGGWTLFARNESVSGLSASGTFSFTAPNGNGYYQFYTLANDTMPQTESAPASADAIAGLDNVAPTSNVNTISPCWQNTSPLTITVTASDTGYSGLASVELWHRYATDNSTWGGWSLFGTDTAAPWSWSFTFPNGTRYYEFYSRARDNATNYEAAPGSRDTLCGYDNAAPTSSVNVISPYWQTTSPLTITATASDTVSGLASVELWHRYSTDNSTWGGWSLFGTDSTAPWSWSFTFPNGTGYYQFYSRARDNATNYEAVPGSADAICGYDNAAPTSSVNAILPYWQTASPLTITGTASDTGYSGLASVELWYRYSADNSTWGGWSLFGTDTASPWQWSFTFPNGTGYYQFYSRAKDNAANYEAAPGSADTICGYDNVAPTSNVNIISPYWQTVSPLTITATASDTGYSGLGSVELWHRYSTDNSTWGGWTLFGTDIASPWSWSFTFPNGTGYYQFYSRAKDNATNYEAAPGSADAICGYDNAAPTSSVNAISPYWQTASPLSITATASDTGYSGLANVELWHRYSTDNSTWGGWSLFGTDTSTPWSWSFTFPDGTGYYEFYSRARDNATNYESAPGSRDALCGYDNVTPTSSVNVISPYWQNTSPLTITGTASDTVSGLAGVELWYRYSANNATWDVWVLFGTDTASPWSWSFNFPNGTGYYEFYSRAKDNATNYEVTPASRDALCEYDNAVPTSSVNVISPYWQTSSPLTITGTASDTGYSGLASVELRHRYSTDNATWGGWTLFGTDTVSPWSWSFTFPNGTGYYEFYSRARDNATNYEAAPGSADAICGYDNAAPTSSVNVISPYWQNTSPLTITGTASDTGYSGLASVELWHRYSADNSSWGGWVLSGTDTASPWQWSFTFSNGTGYYEFYSRARDNATNYEAAPGSADTVCGYDNAVPASNVNTISPYWQTTSPLTITATASDTVSGLANVELWHRYSTDNATWGGWSLFGTDTASPWQWSFTFPNGTGYYQFYSRARDNATNYEVAPGSADAICGYDNAAPTSSVNAILPYWQTSTPFTVTAFASDSVSGVKNVTLYYRYSSDNVTFGGWTSFGTDTVSPWSWSFSAPSGDGYYEFYSVASDNAGLTEGVPGSADAICAVDTNAPYIISTIPTDSATGVSVTQNIIIQFSEKMNTSSVQYTCFPNPGGWVESWNPAKDTLTLSHNIFTGEVTYTFNVTVAKDVAGNNLISGSVPNPWSFTTASGASATAIEPTGYANIYPVTIIYSYSGTPVNVSLYYTTNGGTTWNFIGNDTTVDGSYGWTIPSDGTYGWYCVANGGGSVETAPVSGTAPEASPYIVDTQSPASSVDQISPYWKSSTPFTITATASDSLSGVKNVTLYYRHSSDNSTWGGWTNFGTDTVSPWSWSFTAPSGNGYYEFYSIAVDNANNTEATPASRDSLCGVDTSSPTSSVNTLSPYWQTSTPFTVSASASDVTSGVKNVTLWYRYSTDNTSWGGWTSFGTDTVSPWSWSFTAPSGDGFYEFYSIASDNAGLSEGVPAGRDSLCGVDTGAPVSSVNVISPYWQNTSPLTITGTASDTVSGLAGVELWYRYSANNATWDVWVLFGTDTASPWSWSFNFPNGTGYYQFYTRARDNATNYESAPGSADTICGFDNAAPTSNVNTISPYWQTASPLTITATASDTVSGLASVELWHRFSTDNSTWGGWGLFGTDTASPWSWSFNFPNGTGYYQFYSRAKDNATNYEVTPASRDALCGYDNAVPTSSVNVISPYWQTSTPFTVSASASDTMSGVKNVTLWYRYSSDNSTWGIWTNFGTDTVTPWSWSFSAPSGDGYYQFYSVASDNASLIESVPGSADAICAVDTISPNIISTTPINGATVSVTQNIIIQFSEKMNTSSVQYTCFPNPGNWVGSWNVANDTLTLTHNDFTPEVTYTFNVTIAKDVASHGLVSGPVPNPWSFTTVTTTLPAAPSNLRAEKSGNDIILNWSAVADATEYNIYISTNVDGTGFNFASPNATVAAPITSYNHTGALVDSSNYSYVIKSKNVAGESATASNIAFKLRQRLYTTGIAGGGDNLISLPYDVNITNAGGTNTSRALREDILGAGGLGVTVARWNQSTGIWDTQTALGTKFVLKAGEGYKIYLTNEIWYPLLGSYKPTPINLYTTGIAGGGDNLICLPYNMNITNAGGTDTSRALRESILGAGGLGVTVARWNQSTGIWDTQTALGTKFVLKAGEGYKIYLTNSITWVCTVREPT